MWHEDMVGIVGIYEVRVLGGLSMLMLKYLTMMVRMRWTGKLEPSGESSEEFEHSKCPKHNLCSRFQRGVEELGCLNNCLEVAVWSSENIDAVMRVSGKR